MKKIERVLVIDDDATVTFLIRRMEELARLNINLSDTKIILLSSSQSPWDREKAAKSLAAAFLHKPLTKKRSVALLNETWNRIGYPFSILM